MKRASIGSRFIVASALVIGASLAGCDSNSADSTPGGPQGPCATGLTPCGMACVDTRSDNLNCGTCGTACAVPSQNCTNSSCMCSPGYASCPAGCVNTQTDPANCGGCGVACVAPQVCSLGACSATCTGGLQPCGQSCVDTQADPANCGACNHICGAGQSCVAGSCLCGSGLTACASGCVDTLTDSANCGACGTVCSSGVCQAGVCQGGSSGTGGTAGTGATAGTGGSGAAAGTGGTGATTTGATAGTGGSTTTCDPGLEDCYGACVDLQTDVDHCGNCDTACPTGVCNAGVCPKVKDCYVKTTITSPEFSDFEGYDGTEPVSDWGFAFNAPSGEDGAVYAGPYEYDDGTGTPTLSMALGHDSDYAATVANPGATDWGGGLGFWMSCIDATAYDGISFWVQGSAPSGSATMTVAMEQTSEPSEDDPAGGGTCQTDCEPASLDIPVTSTWTLLQIPWGSFTPGTADGADVPVTGDNITGFAFNVPLVYKDDGTGTWVAVPSDYSLSIDDIQFVASDACPAGEVPCGVGCTNTDTDPDHCGQCGNACPTERTCEAGQCVCPSGYTDCDGECVNLDVDVQHCGQCGVPCSGQCSGGTCQASTCTAGMPHANETCTESAQIFLGKYWLNNNVWGADGASGTQCVWQTCLSGNTIGWGTSWSWNGGQGVVSYASSVLGWHWGSEEQNGNVTRSGLPVQLSSNANVTCGWTFNVDQNGTINVSYDLWAHNTPSPDYQTDPSDEIMIWLYTGGGAGPIGGPVGDVVIDGTTWTLHEGSNGSWDVHSFVRSGNTTSTTLNIMSFLNELVRRGGMSAGQYLTSIEAGTEVYSGTGQLDTDAYFCTIQ